MNYIAAYNEQLNSGKIVASRRVKSVYARLEATILPLFSCSL